MGLEQLKRSLDEKMNQTCYTQAGILKQQNKKPLMERFRRRKINNYLDELKHLVLSALNKEASLYNKMEKADILDMAVRYIKAVRTSSEASTTSYRQEHEHTTTSARGYAVSSPLPLQPRSGNVIYDNLCQSTNITQSSYMKENCSIFENKKISCQDAKVGAKEQFPMSTKENNNITLVENEQTINCETSITKAASNAGIWRPW